MSVTKNNTTNLEARRRLLRELSLVMLMTITGVPKVWLMYSSKLSSAMLIGSSSLMSIAIWTALFICSSENLVGVGSAPLVGSGPCALLVASTGCLVGFSVIGFSVLVEE